jgi:hypothetical protein
LCVESARCVAYWSVLRVDSRIMHVKTTHKVFLFRHALLYTYRITTKNFTYYKYSMDKCFTDNWKKLKFRSFYGAVEEAETKKLNAQTSLYRSCRSLTSRKPLESRYLTNLRGLPGKVTWCVKKKVSNFFYKRDFGPDLPLVVRLLSDLL